jgi:hypothetical protein
MSLHVGKNNIPEKEMRELMAVAMRKDSMTILCEVPIKDKTLTELDISGKNLGMEGALVVADYLDGNGTISTVIVNTFPLPIQDIKSKAKLDFSGKGLKVEDAIIIAALIPSNVSHNP